MPSAAEVCEPGQDSNCEYAIQHPSSLDMSLSLCSCAQDGLQPHPGSVIRARWQHLGGLGLGSMGSLLTALSHYGYHCCCLRQPRRGGTIGSWTRGRSSTLCYQGLPAPTTHMSAQICELMANKCALLEGLAAQTLVLLMLPGKT